MTIQKFLQMADAMLLQEADELLEEEMSHEGMDYSEDWKELHHRRKYLEELIWLANEMKGDRR